MECASCSSYLAVLIRELVGSIVCFYDMESIDKHRYDAVRSALGTAKFEHEHQTQETPGSLSRTEGFSLVAKAGFEPTTSGALASINDSQESLWQFIDGRWQLHRISFPY